MVTRVWFFFSNTRNSHVRCFFFLNQRSEYMNERLKRRPNYYAIEILFNASILAVLFVSKEKKKTQKNRDEHTKASWDKHFDVWRREYLVQTKRDENIAHTLGLDGKRRHIGEFFLEWCDVDMPLGTWNTFQSECASVSVWVWVGVCNYLYLFWACLPETLCNVQVPCFMTFCVHNTVQSNRIICSSVQNFDHRNESTT